MQRVFDYVALVFAYVVLVFAYVVLVFAYVVLVFAYVNKQNNRINNNLIRKEAKNIVSRLF